MILFQTLLSPSALGILVLAMIVLLIGFVMFVKRDSRGIAPKQIAIEKTSVDDYVASHGEPEAVFVLDATRSNELDAVVLVYEHEIVIEGQPLERDKVSSVTFYNAQNPYVEKEFRLVINTTDPELPSVETPMGCDAQQASEIVTQLMEQLHLE